MVLTEEEFVKQVMRHLFRSRGIDLSGYSQSFVLRCIKRRVSRSHSGDPAGYLKVLTRSDDETNELLNTLSINVTEFFRDRTAWEGFVKSVLKPMVKYKMQGGGLLRMWSAGCATGQETYTMAMCVAEVLGDVSLAEQPMVTVLGTDISQRALAKAKAGVYTPEDMRSVPERMASKYFVQKGQSYEISDAVAKRVRFMRENLLDKPSLRYFDVVVCRNVMIYFSRRMHETVAKHLYDALRQGGYLMLGRTETLLGAPRDGFDVIDLENRLLRKK